MSNLNVVSVASYIGISYKVILTLSQPSE